MNTEAEVETELLDDDLEAVDDVAEDDAQDAEPGEELEAEESEESEEQTEEESEDDNEVIVTIGDEAPTPEEGSEAPGWVKNLRKEMREVSRENRELKKQLQEKEEKAAQSQKIELGPMPELEDVDYDTDIYKTKLAEWYETKTKVEKQNQEIEAQEERAKKEWLERLDEYEQQKKALKVKDYDDAEEVVLASFDQVQKGIVVQGAANPALLLYAIGKNPARAEELSKIKDPVKFTFAVAQLEKDLKVTNRKAPPPPEKTLKGSGSKGGAINSTLERLREEAGKTGNFDKLMAYKRKHKL